MKKRKAATSLFLEQQKMAKDDDMLVPEELSEEFVEEDEELEFDDDEAIQDKREILAQNEVDELLFAVSTGGLNEAPLEQQMEAPLQMQMAAPAPPPKPFYKQKAPIKKEKRKKVKNELAISTIKSSEEMQLEKEPIKVRETGAWFWRRVIVPPNAYVVHTRINRRDPITLGMGLSFRYNPNTDAYLVIPAAMQTIGVVANCISKEKQGINVLAYVQWQIDDFSIAYKKLDFSDSYDPLGIVNAQLREQAEAAIKDKIATMSVEEVLTDKEPVIEELTSRLKLVAEGQAQGNGSTSEGLGIKITTVQIREALVSSESLWNDLQSPFRHEQKKKASISYLEMKNEIKRKELDTKRNIETEESQTNLEISKIKEKTRTETLQLQLNEETVRYTKQQESAVSKLKKQEETDTYQKEMEDRMVERENSIRLKRELETLKQDDEREKAQVNLDFEKEKRAKELSTEQELFKLKEHMRLEKERRELRKHEIEENLVLNELENELNVKQQEHFDRLGEQRVKGEIERHVTKERAKLSMEEEKNSINYRQEKQLVEIEKSYQEIRNLINNSDLTSRLIKQLPKIAAEMPDIKELKVLQTGDKSDMMDSFASFLARALSLADSLGIKLPKVVDKD